VAVPKRPSFDAALINSPDQPAIASGVTGSGVVRAQVLLGRAHFSCGEIDGDFGTNLKKVVAAYQQDRNLSVTASV
jgi:peptidoglycan hydrolase-like protein with peptidoglycan-binding domain